MNSAQLTAAISLQPVQELWAQILVYSPLHLAWLGGEAVWLFFVLSGFVLTRAASHPEFSWESYYPSRVVRLYLPVFGAIALAWLTYLYPHVLKPGMDQLLPVSYPPVNLLQDATLIGGTSTSLGVLWSLQWEVIFSLALPLYLLVGRRWPVIGGAAGLLLCLAGWWLNVPAPAYLPMFLLGVILAMQWERIERASRFLSSGRLSSHLAGSGLLLVAAAGLLAYYLLGPLLGAAARIATVPITLAAIALTICLAQTWPPLRAFLSARPLAFLGQVSYSLYLVHMPLVVLFVFVFGPGAVAAAAAVLVSLSACVVFYYAVERPAHKLSRRISRDIRYRARVTAPAS